MKNQKNANLSAAKKAKNDEFYTQLTDIEKELRHYRKHFAGKTVLCNCDDPFESNFFKYFVLNFNKLKLKKLIATCYATSPISGNQLRYGYDNNGQAFISFGKDEKPVNHSKKPYKAVITVVEDADGDGGVDMIDVAELFKQGKNELVELKEDGDFRSPECIELLKEADIVVTNPPFSLWREFVSLLMEYEKQFVIIGNQNAITYKEIFPLIKDNKLWLGNGFSGNVAFFQSPYEDIATSTQHKKGLIRVSGVMWFTNLDIKKRHEELILYKKYQGHEDEYPKYDNYDAIEVSKTKEIPYDYDGVMGVPITFLDKYSPDQFEIIGFFNNYNPLTAKLEQGMIYGEAVKVTSTKSLFRGPVVNGKAKYFRILIRNKHPEIDKKADCI